MIIKTRDPKPTKSRSSSISKPPDLEKVFNAVSGRRIGNSVCFLWCGKNSLVQVDQTDMSFLVGVRGSKSLYHLEVTLLTYPPPISPPD